MPDECQSQEPDEAFYHRADAHIDLCNEQMLNAAMPNVSSSMVYGTARFHAWISACSCGSGRKMAKERGSTIEFFTREYRQMLEENLDDYIENFEAYLRTPQGIRGPQLPTEPPTTEPNEAFFCRADDHIHLSNEQTSQIGSGKVSASMMYAAARFNAWLTACDFPGGRKMAEKRQTAIDCFNRQYRLMLEENLDDYIQNFDSHMGIAKPK